MTPPPTKTAPHPAIRLGIAGWSIASRYRDEFPDSGSQLEKYAHVFRVAEINTSFYRPHRATTYARWAESVAADFRFSVKLPRALTHEDGLVSGKHRVRDQFLSEVAGLGPKFAILLVQLPPGLAFEARKTRSFFRSLRSALPSHASIVCEPRHPSWATDAADDLLRQLSVSRVAADPSRWERDAHPGGERRLAYFRLHGSPRIYFSDYEPQRLEQLREQLLSAAHTSASVWCIFDNTAHGHAIGNAQWMQRALAVNAPRRQRRSAPRR